jgi:hypothetical protein
MNFKKGTEVLSYKGSKVQRFKGFLKVLSVIKVLRINILRSLRKSSCALRLKPLWLAILKYEALLPLRKSLCTLWLKPLR